VGDAWAWYDPESPWTTSQWLAEIAMAAIVDRVGWYGLVAVSVVLVTAIMGVGYALLRQRVSPPAVLVPYAILTLLVVLSAQPRPALVSILGVLLVAHAAERCLLTGRVPHLWTTLALVLWANIHGLWVIAPASLTLAGLLYWTSQGREDKAFIRRLFVIVAAWTIAGVTSPLGLGGLLLPFTLAGTTEHLQEWQRSSPWSIAFIPLGLTLMVILIRSRRAAVLHSSVVKIWVTFWVVFSLPALRNVIVSVIMLLPLVASSMREEANEQPSRGSTYTSPFTGLLSALVTAVMCLAILLRINALDPLADARPMKIAEYLASAEGRVRVLNDYNTAGVLLAFGPREVELGIDGRAERYGADYIREYLELIAVRGQRWPSLLDRLNPDYAVLEGDSALRYVLRDVRGWQEVLRDGDYVLLEAPP